MQDAVVATKAWCTLGIIGWLFTGFAYWMMEMLMLAFQSMYATFPPTIYERAGVWLRCSAVIAPLVLLISWHRNAKQGIYLRAQRSKKTPSGHATRVVCVALPGILGGIGGCCLFSLIIGS
ncbi:MAG TPA: hypothetical protein DF699_00380 [Phycisphaerales bacterium]|nr:hypothetical protein [Phycisphaerales bacterium]